MRVLIALGLAPIVATGLHGQEHRGADSAAVAAAVHALHAALEQGDSARVVALFAADARILEAGQVETRAEYAAHHLASDIAAAQALTGDHVIGQLTIADSVAWVVSKYTSHGTLRGRTVNNEGAELVVLRRAGASWEILAIHWSSRRRSVE